MQFTPGQLRETVGLSKETFRHWKRVLPPLATGRGHSPGFTSGDLLAAAVLKRLTEDCGVRVGHLQKIAVSLFGICNRSSWAELEGQLLIVDVSGGRCDLSTAGGDIAVERAAVICALGPIVDSLSHQLLPLAVNRNSAQRSRRSSTLETARAGGAP